MSDSFRVALVTPHDPAQPRAFSGIIHFAVDALRRRNVVVEWVGPPAADAGLRQRVRRTLRRLRLRASDAPDPVQAARAGAIAVQNRLLRGHYDAVLAFVASHAFALVATRLPVVYATDAVFAAMPGFYENFTNLPAAVHEVLDRHERAALDKASLVQVASEWAKEAAMRHYGVAEGKIRVVPYGANLRAVPAPRVRAVDPGKEVRFLFLAKADWERKGGPDAVAVVRALRRRGVPGRLRIVGLEPGGLAGTEGVDVIGYLDKSDPVQAARLDEELHQAHFCLLPTRAETVGIAFCEAAAHALPAVARRVGGVPSVVEDGRTGLLLPPEAGAEEFARAIGELVAAPARYAAMSAAARRAFEERLNWDVWAAATEDMLRSVAQRPRAQRGA
ncbi:MAG: glycosyltransferase family 4 protein [Planctomycetes bacterium]|nr:glycosyltransferase family 4 protein [Planctomycetota bacterium]